MAQPAHQSPPAPRLDWEAIRQRLEATRIVLESGATIDREQAQRILRTRAAELARKEETHSEQEWLDAVEFQLAHEMYALASDSVREVFPLNELTPLPGTPSFVLGITNLRGRIVSIIDLKRFFDLPNKGLTDLNKVILLHHGAMELGILADRVLGIRRIEIATLQPVLPTLTGNRADYLQGLTPDGLILLNAARILTDPHLVVRDELDL